MYLTPESRQAISRKRQDERDAQLQDLAAHNLARTTELIRRETELNNKIRTRNQELRAKELRLQQREERLLERELNLKQQERNVEEKGKQVEALRAQQNDRPFHGIQKDLLNKHAKLVKDGPNASLPRPAVSPTTPSLPKNPAVLPPPTGSIPSSGPAQLPCPQSEISTPDAANELTYSCIRCSKPDTHLMIACQNGKECRSRQWEPKNAGIHSGNDAWFHINHVGVTEAALYEFTKSKEDWYCQLCQGPIENTDPDEYTTPERTMTPDPFMELDKYTIVKLRRMQTESHDHKKSTTTKRSRQTETDDPQEPTTIKRRRQTETPEPKKPNTTRRRRQAVTPDSKNSTNGEKSPKKSSRRKCRSWKDPLECQALIDSMRTVIETNDKTERRYETASALMLSRGFDRSRYQIKNKWNREMRKEARRQGLPEDRREKPGLKLVTGVQTPADRKRKREEKRKEKEQQRALEEALFAAGSAKRMAETEEEDGEENAEENAEGVECEQVIEGEQDAEGEDCEEDVEGEDFEEYIDDADDDDEDEEEGTPNPKRQRFS